MNVIEWAALNVIAFIISAPWIEKNGLIGLATFFIFTFGITFLAKVVLPIMLRHYSRSSHKPVK